MAFALPPLPYAYDALEPYIDSTTVRVRRGSAGRRAALVGDHLGGWGT